MRWRFFGVVTLVIMSGCRTAAKSDDVGLRTTVIAMPADSLGAFEPHISVDPDDPNRAMLLAAGYRYRAHPAAWCATVRAWSTHTSGREWSSAQDLGYAAFGAGYSPEHSDFTLDPVVAPGRAQRWFALVVGGRRSNRYRSNDLVLVRADRDGWFAFNAQLHGSVRSTAMTDSAATCGLDVAVNRSAPAGHTAPFGFDRSLAGHADKPWLAVDLNRGHVHVAWSVAVDSTGERFALYASTMQSHDSVFAEPVLIAPAYRGLVHGVQVGVQRNGRVDVLWAENARGRRVVRHSSSDDAGSSYSAPVDAVARPETSGQIRNLTIAYARDQLVACWTERQTRRPDGSNRVHENLWCSERTPQGWTAAAPVDTDSLTFEKLTFGALAANRAGLWLLAYRSTGDSTHVDLLNSRSGLRWRTYARLASRGFSANDYELGGPVAIGDYVGLDAALDRVYAAYILPESALRTKGILYVSVVRTRPG